LLKLLHPDLYLESLFDIDPELLKKRGISALIFDLDNTLVARGENKAEPEVLEWLRDLRRHGFKLCIVSNNSRGKGGRLARILDLPGVFAATKPRRWAFRKALALLGTQASETAVVGDQVFTDVLGGNRMGLFTILVSSLGGPDFILTRLIVRRIERLILPWVTGRGRNSFSGIRRENRG
jgi:HAD superfamily phosphatase (TIGR01668 family)